MDKIEAGINAHSVSHVFKSATHDEERYMLTSLSFVTLRLKHCESRRK